MTASVDALQSQLHKALDFDQKKKQINDAKLRAVSQKVEYEAFEKMVAGAHLKPIKPKSQESAAISRQFAGYVSFSWCSIASTSSGRRARSCTEPSFPLSPRTLLRMSVTARCGIGGGQRCCLLAVSRDEHCRSLCEHTDRKIHARARAHTHTNTKY